MAIAQNETSSNGTNCECPQGPKGEKGDNGLQGPPGDHQSLFKSFSTLQFFSMRGVHFEGGLVYPG
jgi:hypothetical protein